MWDGANYRTDLKVKCFPADLGLAFIPGTETNKEASKGAFDSGYASLLLSQAGEDIFQGGESP